MTVGKIFFALGLAGAAILMLWPRPQGADHILLGAVTASPLDPDGAVAIFMKIENRGTPDRIIGVSSPAGHATLYTPEADDGLPTPGGSDVSLAADGAHVRLTGLDQPIAHGQLIPVHLEFEMAGRVSTKARLIDPETIGDAQEVGLFGLGDICRVGEGEPAPQIALSVSQDPDGWSISVDADEFEFSQELVGLYHVPGMGHGHLYVGGMKLGRLYTPEARIGTLPSGQHLVRVTLNTNDHRAYVVGDEPVTATVLIEVD